MHRRLGGPDDLAPIPGLPRLRPRSAPPPSWGRLHCAVCPASRLRSAALCGLPRLPAEVGCTVRSTPPPSWGRLHCAVCPASQLRLAALCGLPRLPAWLHCAVYPASQLRSAALCGLPGPCLERKHQPAFQTEYRQAEIGVDWGHHSLLRAPPPQSSIIYWLNIFSPILLNSFIVYPIQRWLSFQSPYKY